MLSVGLEIFSLIFIFLLPPYYTFLGLQKPSLSDYFAISIEIVILEDSLMQYFLEYITGKQFYKLIKHYTFDELGRKSTE